MKLKHIALAVVAATSFGAANAAVDTTAANAQLWFAAESTSGSYSYVFNTGATLASLKNGSISFSASLSSDSVWQSFLTDIGGISNVKWTVGAYQGGSGVNRGFYTTVSSDSALVSAVNMPTYSTLSPTLANTVTVMANSADSQEAAAGTPLFFTLDNYSTAGITSIFNAVGTSNVKFLGLQGTSTTSTSKLAGISNLAATASFSTSGVLTIGAPVVPSVPEPESYGLALVGLLLAGAVARRRAA